MKVPFRKIREDGRSEDDSLFGLLSSYKRNVTYFRILVSEMEGSVVLQLTDNPRNWMNIAGEKYTSFREMKRLEMGITKLSVKYLSPEHIIKFLGPLLGMKLPSKKVTIVNNLGKDSYFILEAPIDSLQLVLQSVKRLINLSPQKKYEIIEKCITDTIQG